MEEDIQFYLDLIDLGKKYGFNFLIPKDDEKDIDKFIIDLKKKEIIIE